MPSRLNSSASHVWSGWLTIANMADVCQRIRAALHVDAVEEHGPRLHTFVTANEKLGDWQPEVRTGLSFIDGCPLHLPPAAGSGATLYLSDADYHTSVYTSLADAAAVSAAAPSYGHPPLSTAWLNVKDGHVAIKQTTLAGGRLWWTLTDEGPDEYRRMP